MNTNEQLKRKLCHFQNIYYSFRRHSNKISEKVVYCLVDQKINDSNKEHLIVCCEFSRENLIVNNHRGSRLLLKLGLPVAWQKQK